MSVLAPLACLAGRHKPLRREAEWDGQKYIGHCRYCGKAIERIAHRQWRERRE